MEVIFFESASGFRAWLEENHEQAMELPVGFYKVNSGEKRRDLTQTTGYADPGLGEWKKVGAPDICSEGLNNVPCNPLCTRNLYTSSGNWYTYIASNYQMKGR